MNGPQAPGPRPPAGPAATPTAGRAPDTPPWGGDAAWGHRALVSWQTYASHRREVSPLRPFPRAQQGWEGWVARLDVEGQPQILKLAPESVIARHVATTERAMELEVHPQIRGTGDGWMLMDDWGDTGMLPEQVTPDEIQRLIAQLDQYAELGPPPSDAAVVPVPAVDFQDWLTWRPEDALEGVWGPVPGNNDKASARWGPADWSRGHLRPRGATRWGWIDPGLTYAPVGWHLEPILRDLPATQMKTLAETLSLAVLGDVYRRMLTHASQRLAREGKTSHSVGQWISRLDLIRTILRAR